jgi:aerobic-type carbon monoxide dehydrogenase small subunit (CoxS/CutS family)
VIPPTSSERAEITVNGAVIETRAGVPLGAVLHQHDAVLRHTARRGAPRGIFCGMGVCFDCLVTVDDRPNVRACITPVRDGMRVECT